MRITRWALMGLVVYANMAVAELPLALQDLGLREAAVASRDMPGWKKPDRIVVRNMFGQDMAAGMAVSFKESRSLVLPARRRRSPPWLVPRR